jgi:uncharacterized protein (TIGR02996 family)
MAERSREELQLRRAIFANPDDDVPRQVYADWLLARGLPGGERLAFELRSMQPARESFSRDPTPLSDVPGSIGAWKRGFPIDFAFRPPPSGARPFEDWATIEEWATLERFETHIDVRGDLTPFFLRVIMRGGFDNLRTLTGVPAGALSALAARLPRMEHLSKLEVCGNLGPEHAEALSALRRVHLIQLDWQSDLSLARATRGFGVGTRPRACFQAWATLSKGAITVPVRYFHGWRPDHRIGAVSKYVARIQDACLALVDRPEALLLVAARGDALIAERWRRRRSRVEFIAPERPL